MTEERKVLKRIIDNERIVSQMEILCQQLMHKRGCEALDLSFCKEYGLDYSSIISALLAAYSEDKDLKK